jgi:hypothetical protein
MCRVPQCREIQSTDLRRSCTWWYHVRNQNFPLLAMVMVSGCRAGEAQFRNMLAGDHAPAPEVRSRAADRFVRRSREIRRSFIPD